MIVMLAFLVVLSVEDVCEKRVHTIILYAFLATGIVMWFITGNPDLPEFVGGMVAGGMVWIFSCLAPDRLGCADGMVFTATGIFLGLTGNIILMTVSMLLAGAGSLFAVVIMKKDRDDTMPLIPFIAAGAVVLMMEGL